MEEARAAPALAARRVPGRRSSVFADTQLEAEASAEAARGDDDELPHAPIATALSEQLMQLRRRLREDLGELDDARVCVRLTRAGPGALYPTARWAAGFFKWYATTRKRPDTLSRWHGSRTPVRRPPPASRGAARTWRRTSLRSRATGCGRSRGRRRRRVDGGAQILALRREARARALRRRRRWHGGGGGEGRGAHRGAAAGRLGVGGGGGGGGRRARVEAEAALVAATSAPLARGHLYQVGEWQMQDALLSEPFERNKAAVVGAYLPFARHTGCRPGWR